MSDKCGNCDCSDSSQCTKKGYIFDAVMDTENSHFDAMAMDVAAAENDCKCGPGCTCTNCGCHH